MALLHPAGISAPTDAGPRAPPPTMAGTADKAALGGQGPECWCILAPFPTHTFTAQRHLLSSAPSPSGALNHSSPLLPGRRAVTPGPHAGRQLAWLSRPLLSPLYWNTIVISPGPWGQSRDARVAEPKQTPRPGLHRRLTGARATGGRQKSWSATRMQGLLSTVLRPSFIHPPFVQVSPHTTLIKYPLESSMPAAAPSELSSRALTVGAQHPD